MTHFTLEQKPGGRVFFLGDIHGNLEIVANLISQEKFIHKKDIIVSVGDLIDRGHSSKACLELTKQPWFHAIRGNHEQVLIDATEDAGYVHYHKNRVGGGWFYALCDEERMEMKALASALPNALTVNLLNGMRIGVTHAECTVSRWSSFVEAITQGDDVISHSAMWSRERMDEQDERVIEGIDLVIVGHTKSKDMQLLGNTKYIDTGRYQDPTAAQPYVDDNEATACALLARNKAGNAEPEQCVADDQDHAAHAFEIKFN